jgi:hypothetical protein
MRKSRNETLRSKGVYRRAAGNAWNLSFHERKMENLVRGLGRLRQSQVAQDRGYPTTANW